MSCDNYREYLNLLIDNLPQKGYGAKRSLSKHLKVHPTFIGQVLIGSRNFSNEQMLGVAEFFHLSELETDFILALLNWEKAGNQVTKNYFNKKIATIRRNSKNLSKIVAQEKVLSEAEKSVFYSDWVYSAVRQLVSIEDMNTVQSLLEKTKLPTERIYEILDFLNKCGLILEVEGKYRVGPKSTHLESTSPWIKANHSTWRQMSIQRMTHRDEQNLFVSCPATLSEKDFFLVREKLLKYVESIFSIIDVSKSEQLVCLNLDWFKVF